MPSSTVIKRWVGVEKRPSKKVVPVAVRQEHAPNGNRALALVTPTGIRLEGLTVGEATECDPSAKPGQIAAVR